MIKKQLINNKLYKLVKENRLSSCFGCVFNIAEIEISENACSLNSFDRKCGSDNIYKDIEFGKKKKLKINYNDIKD